MNFSRRSGSVDTSGIRRVFDLGAKLSSPINLSIGQPDFDALPEVKEATKAAIDAGRSRYSVTQGIAELREEIGKKFNLNSGKNQMEHACGDVDVMITSGVSGGFLLAYMALLDPGDEVLIPDPFFGMYRDLALLLNAVPVSYNCYPDFSPAVLKIEKLITEKTKVVVLNSPGNPTGYAITEGEMDGILAMAKKAGIWVIYDEIYSEFCYDKPHVSGLNKNGRLKYKKIIILNGFSKSHGVPGWRMGYAIGCGEVLQQMTKIQQYSFVCAPSMAQYGLVPGVSIDLSGITRAYKAKRDFMCAELAGKYEFVTPGGSFYMFVKVPGNESGSSFVERCIDENLLLVPGGVFSNEDTHFRLSFAAADSVLENGVKILTRLA